jgi:hypothetical protein
MVRIFAYKAQNLLNPSRHQIWAIHHQLEPLNWPRSKSRPWGRRWKTSWSRSFTGGRPHRRLSRLPVDRLLWPDFATISGQKKFLSYPRSRRKNCIRVWWPIGRAWAPSSWRPWCPRRSASVEPSQGRRRALSRSFVDRRPGLERGYPFSFIKIRASKKEPMAQINPTFFCWKIIQ